MTQYWTCSFAAPRAVKGRVASMRPVAKFTLFTCYVCDGVCLLYTEVYVKVYMLYKGRRMSRKQTRAATCGIVAPSVAVFNEALLFDMDARQSLAETGVELALIDCHRVTKDEQLGRLVVVSPFDGGDRPGHLPGAVAAARGPHAGAGGGERSAVGGSDRSVAVWHRLAA